MDTRYRRSEHIDMETLGDELILMNADSREVVTLNSTAQALWECLEDEISGTEIMAIFSELYPDVAAAALEQDIAATLTRLRTAGLIEASETNA
ncbi:MAG: PqqD family protein [Alphaproteobacteria bacterium]|nr:PqqD family protein [Alphaproteobacteria bacterium]